MQHIWSILCSRSIIDQETNSISLIDSLEEITVGIRKEDKKKDKITVSGLFYNVVSFIVRDKTKSVQKGELSIELINPNKKAGKKYIQKFIMKKGIKRIRLRTAIGGLVLSSEGRYIFKVGLKKDKDKTFKTVSELPLDVKFKEIKNENK